MNVVEKAVAIIFFFNGMGYLTKDNRFHAFALMGTLTFLALEKSFMNVM